MYNYNTKGSTFWALARDGIRNTHNFLKTCLIQTHVPKHACVIDLGCGHGGDLGKISYINPRKYIGIDFAKHWSMPYVDPNS